MGADEECLVWACSLARWVPGNMNVQYGSVSIMLCQLNPHCLWPQAFRHIMLWYLVLTHTPYLTTFLPLWLQDRETSLFTRYERGSLTIWGLMKFPWIRNASACQTLGWKSYEIWSVWADKPVCFVDYHSLPRISHIKPWNDLFMTAC